MWDSLVSGGVEILDLLAQKGAGFVVVAFLESILVGNKVKQYLKQYSAQIAALDTPASK